ncbi:twin-arginine translocation pathway signal protein [bacterium]|nr:twin-arginine translocation pathway signal protein [bacterium]
MTSRRNVLRLIGGGVVLAATAGASGFYLSTRPSTLARAPWREAGEAEGLRERFLSYAILAPNPHNRQPWLVRLDGDDALSLYCDLDRLLPATDPFDRQITIGCGAFLELLSIAAAAEGYRADISLFPDGEPQPRLDSRPVAQVRFVSGGAVRDPAFDHVLKRLTNREVYTAKTPAAADLAAIAEAGTVGPVAARTSSEPAMVARLRDLTWAGHEVESLTYETMKESVDLMRIGRRQIDAHRDGLFLEGPFIEGMVALGIVTPEAMLDPSTSAFQQGMEMFRARAYSAQAFAWMTTAGNTRADQIAAGRAYARMTLKIAELGLAVHPWSQTLQEYPEMAAHYDEAHNLLGEGGTVQMLVRVGFAPKAAHAPRRDPASLLIT